MAPPNAETSELVQEFKDLNLKELAKTGAYTVYPETKVYFALTAVCLFSTLNMLYLV